MIVLTNKMEELRINVKAKLQLYFICSNEGGNGKSHGNGKNQRNIENLANEKADLSSLIFSIFL